MTFDQFLLSCSSWKYRSLYSCVMAQKGGEASSEVAQHLFARHTLQLQACWEKTGVRQGVTPLPLSPTAGAGSAYSLTKSSDERKRETSYRREGEVQKGSWWRSAWSSLPHHKVLSRVPVPLPNYESITWEKRVSTGEEKRPRNESPS